MGSVLAFHIVSYKSKKAWTCGLPLLTVSDMDIGGWTGTQHVPTSSSMGVKVEAQQ